MRRFQVLHALLFTCFHSTVGFKVQTHPFLGRTSAKTSIHHATAPDSVAEPETSLTVRIEKPLGLVLEEGGEYDGIVVVEMDPEGNAARTTSVCLGDRIVGVGSENTESKTLETVLDLIRDEEDLVDLTISRPSAAVIVQFPNGVRVAATANEYIGNVADRARFPIKYQCRSGSCGTCEQTCVVGSSPPKRLRPCVALVPNRVREIRVGSPKDYGCFTVSP